MRIFHAIEWVKSNVRTPAGTVWHDDASTGYGNVRRMIEAWAESRGHELSPHPYDCDVELHVGDPGVKPDRHFSPSILMTMFEQTRFPEQWVPPMTNWDIIAVPSKWCQQCFKQQLREAGSGDAAKRVRAFRLGISADRFPFLERPQRDGWTVICQGVELRDRKGLVHVHNVMRSHKLPSDMNILLKHLPLVDQSVIADGYDMQSGALRICAKLLDSDEFLELLRDCDYSVNPTGGEGFGLIPLEHLSTGLGVAVTRFSGVTDYYTPAHFHQITHRLKAGVYPYSRAALPQERSIYNRMMWSYEHQDEVRRMGRAGAAWVKEHWSQPKMWDSLDELFGDAAALPRIDNDNREECNWELEPGLIFREGKDPIIG